MTIVWLAATAAWSSCSASLGDRAIGPGPPDAASADLGQEPPPDRSDRPGPTDLPVRDAAAIEIEPVAIVDASTLQGKMLFGYQGWFAAPGDGSTVNEWHHWLSPTGTPSPLVVDMWPDLSEYEPDERFTPPGLTLPGGEPAAVFSAFKDKTVSRHFAWMREHDLDGVFLQRFLGEIQDPRYFAFRNQVTRNVRAGAESSGRVFAIEYDLSLPQPMQATIVEKMKADWMYLVDTLQVTASDRYLREGGKPVVAIWGFGFIDRLTTPQQAQALITWFKTGAPPAYRATVVGGVPWGWRTQSGTLQTDPAWAPVFRSLDVVSPWTVGHYASDAAADKFINDVVAGDIVETRSLGIGYLPVIFPGFSWHNLMGAAPSNQIPRRGGRFYWRQAMNVVAAGATMFKTAMFDEIDEGTAMFKLAPTAATAPARAPMVTLDTDGESLPSDWYLRLAGAATEVLRGQRDPSVALPFTPTP
ncbi:MAG TPA: glycoside hydrolase family 71/99-like protein [Polyangia bacterium]|nr:glycoside hydrolase family 71/99-like protein [Polyangia bacterium]